MSVYAVSDLHGCLDTYYKIKKLLKPEDKVYCLGDCGDRGPEPWATIKSVYQDPQFIYLKGNHEDMLTKASWEVLYHSSSKYQRLLAHNGGYDTLLGLLEEKEPLDWISKLEDLPTSEYYINKKGQKIFLSHAGYSFWADEPKPKIKDKDLLWDRLHFYDSANLLSNIIVIHGHTPIRYLAREIDMTPSYSALKYANGKKYCIDAGTFFTGRSILFNLDTFKSIIVK